MRHLVTALGIVCLAGACDGSADESDASGDAGDVQQEVLGPPEHFFAVLIRDAEDFECSATHRAHGADIDAVELIGSDGKRIAWLDKVDVDFGDDSVCSAPLANKHKNEGEARGAADGVLDDGFVALSGGWLLGEFKDRPEIVAGQTIRVYEVGSDAGGLDEPYTVYLASGLDCDPDEDPCTVKLGAGTGTTSLAVTPF